MKTVLIGAGNLASNLAPALRKAGHDIVAVYSRTRQSAEALATEVGARATDSISDLPVEADLFIIAVKDTCVATLIPQLVKGRQQQLFVHTAGSLPMSLFEGHATRYGVFYPMQTFSRQRRLDFTDIPLFLEASDAQTLQTLHELAGSLSQQVYDLSSADRRHLHLAAVYACNFANHCFALSADILERHGLPFSVMLPLIDETARKVHSLHPRDAQTGPAVRFDENVMQKHLQLLAGEPLLSQIYELLSQSIHQTAINTQH